MALERLRLDGQVALITGGGRGIGRGIASVLSEAGAAVTITARSPDEVRDTAEMIRSRGGRALAVQADVTQRSDNERAVQAALDEFGRLDILVNNAGGSSGAKPMAQLTEDLFRADLELNMLSAFTLTQIAAPHLAKGGRGSVINISSRAGAFAAPGRMQYGVAKAALDHLTRLMAQELAPHVRVNGIGVGTVMTAALQRGFAQTGGLEDLTAKIPLNRLGDVEDIGLTALYFCAQGCYVTGVVLPVDGGLQASPAVLSPRPGAPR